MIAPGRRSKCSRMRPSIVSWETTFVAEAVDQHAQRVRDADGVGDLDLAAVGEPAATTFFAT